MGCCVAYGDDAELRADASAASTRASRRRRCRSRRPTRIAIASSTAESRGSASRATSPSPRTRCSSARGPSCFFGFDAFERRRATSASTRCSSSRRSTSSSRSRRSVSLKRVRRRAVQHPPATSRSKGRRPGTRAARARSASCSSTSRRFRHHLGRRRTRHDAAADRGAAAPRRRARQGRELDAQLLPDAAAPARLAAQLDRAPAQTRAAPARLAASQPARGAARPHARQGRQPEADGRQPLRAAAAGAALAKRGRRREQFAPAQFENIDDADEAVAAVLRADDERARLSADGRAARRRAAGQARRPLRADHHRHRTTSASAAVRRLLRARCSLTSCAAPRSRSRRCRRATKAQLRALRRQDRGAAEGFVVVSRRRQHAVRRRTPRSRPRPRRTTHLQGAIATTRARGATLHVVPELRAGGMTQRRSPPTRSCPGCARAANQHRRATATERRARDRDRRARPRRHEGRRRRRRPHAGDADVALYGRATSSASSAARSSAPSRATGSPTSSRTTCRSSSSTTRISPGATRRRRRRRAERRLRRGSRSSCSRRTSSRTAASGTGRCRRIDVADPAAVPAARRALGVGACARQPRARRRPTAIVDSDAAAVAAALAGGARGQSRRRLLAARCARAAWSRTRRTTPSSSRPSRAGALAGLGLDPSKTPDATHCAWDTRPSRPREPVTDALSLLPPLVLPHRHAAATSSIWSACSSRAGRSARRRAATWTCSGPASNIAGIVVPPTLKFGGALRAPRRALSRRRARRGRGTGRLGRPVAASVPADARRFHQPVGHVPGDRGGRRQRRLRRRRARGRNGQRRRRHDASGVAADRPRSRSGDHAAALRRAGTPHASAC